MIELVIQEDGKGEADLKGAVGTELLDDLASGKAPFVGIGKCEVEVEVVESSFGQEVAAGGEAFQVKGVIFDEARDGFELTLKGVCWGRDADPLSLAEGWGETVALASAAFTSNELAAIIGLSDQFDQGDSEALDAGGEDLTGGSAVPLSEGEEKQAAAGLAGRVLDPGQVESLGRRQVKQDLIDVFGVGTNLLEQPQVAWRAARSCSFDTRGGGGGAGRVGARCAEWPCK